MQHDLRSLFQAERLVVAGAMSGTSCDGVSVAVLEIARRESAPHGLEATLLAEGDAPYPATLREELLRAAELPIPELASLHLRLGRRFAEAVVRVAAESPTALDLVACHGHTLFHRGVSRDAAAPAVSWQIGEAAEVAALCGCPVVADFRPADLARGGQGAPLVPFGDAVLFGSVRGPRACLNLGGIANVTVMEAGGPAVLAFDCGPANALLDLVMRRRCDQSFDDGGRLAASGTVDPAILDRMLAHPYFAAPPPKSTGRELFGESFLNELAPGWESTTPLENLLATLTELTAESVRRALASSPLEVRDLVVAGGGVRNDLLMARLEALLAPLPVLPSEELGWPIGAREAACFALLGAAYVWSIPATSPACTGCDSAAILGKLSLPPPE